MGFGLPAIASTSGAAHEIVVQNETGFLVKPGDVGAITAQIDNLHRNRNILYEMSIKALSYYYKHPTWAETGEKVSRFLRDMLHR